MAAISFSGLVSGLDTDRLIPQLVRFNQQRLDVLQLREVEIAARRTLFQEIEARLLTLQSEAERLGRAHNSAFQARTAVSSDEGLLKAAAGTGAQPGVLSLRVLETARAGQAVSQGFASPGARISQGTFQISAGAGTATITIDGTNDTLQGLAQAINTAGVGVGAVVLNDGSAGTPSRLLLTSASTGTARDIVITNDLDDGTNGGVKPEFAVLQQATNAQVQLGSGAGAFTVESATNRITGLVAGVTLDVQAADPGREVTVTIGNDTSAARESILNFVESFNDLMEFLDEHMRFDAETGQAGPLLGNTSAIGMQDAVRQAVLSVSPLLPASSNRLGAVGITVNTEGRLVVDPARLDAALNGQVEGMAFRDVHRLFALTGESTNPGVQFIIAGSNTRESAVPYQVFINQAAEQATIAGGALAETTEIDAANNTLTVRVNGRNSAELTLAAGTYTRQQLAAEIESKINADPTLAGRRVAVTLAGNGLRITSAAFGFASEVGVVSGTALADLGFSGTESARGRDVVGRFIVNGVEEQAIGSGQVLTGSPNNANTADLRVLVTLTPGQVQTPGVQAELTVTRGVAARLEQVMDRLLDPVNGRLRTIDNRFKSEIEAAQRAVERESEAMDNRTAALLRQFAAMEQAISLSRSRSDQIANQLGVLLQSQRR